MSYGSCDLDSLMIGCGIRNTDTEGACSASTFYDSGDRCGLVVRCDGEGSVTAEANVLCMKKSCLVGTSI